VGGIVADTAVFRLSISRFFPEIFAIEVYKVVKNRAKLRAGNFKGTGPHKFALKLLSLIPCLASRQVDTFGEVTTTGLKLFALIR